MAYLVGITVKSQTILLQQMDQLQKIFSEMNQFKVLSM